MKAKTKSNLRWKESSWIAAAMLTLSLGFPGGPVPATAAPLVHRTDINPAVLYWQGFSLFPDLPAEIRKDLMSDPPRLPLEEAEPFLRKFDGTFKYLRRAAQMKVRCDWGVDLADGPAALMPNLVKIRQCAQASSVRAHYALEAGRDQDAVDNLAAALVLGRHAGADGTLVSTMIGIAVERLVISFVAQNFHRFGPRALISLTQQIEAAPRRATVKEAMNTEQAAFSEWFIPRIEELRAAHPSDEGKAVAAVRELLISTLDKADVIDPIVAAAGGTTAGLISYFKELRPLYDALLRAADATPSRVEEEFRVTEDLIKKHPNLLARIIFPNLSKARKAEFGVIAQAAMLRAAVALRLEGERGFEKIQDPFGEGPFTLRRLPSDSGETGFELESKISVPTMSKVALKFLEDAPRPKAQPSFE